MTLEDIGEQLRIPERIRQIKDKAITKLRSQSRSRPHKGLLRPITFKSLNRKRRSGIRTALFL